MDLRNMGCKMALAKHLKAGDVVIFMGKSLCEIKRVRGENGGIYALLGCPDSMTDDKSRYTGYDNKEHFWWEDCNVVLCMDSHNP
jgi:hypothetical protein